MTIPPTERSDSEVERLTQAVLDARIVLQNETLELKNLTKDINHQEVVTKEARDELRNLSQALSEVIEQDIEDSWPEGDLRPPPKPARIEILGVEAKPTSPHSRACGARAHKHGSQCHRNCPTCNGRPLPSDDGDAEFAGRRPTGEPLEVSDEGGGIPFDDGEEDDRDDMPHPDTLPATERARRAVALSRHEDEVVAERKARRRSFRRDV